MSDDEVERLLDANRLIDDRFTFDHLFRTLLSAGYSNADCVETIIFYCSLSALVYQERIHNGFWRSISVNEKLSRDLRDLLNDEFARKIKSEHPESLN